MPFSIFPYIGFLIIPIDSNIFFRGVAQPPTRMISCKLCLEFKPIHGFLSLLLLLFVAAAAGVSVTLVAVGAFAVALFLLT